MQHFKTNQVELNMNTGMSVCYCVCVRCWYTLSSYSGFGDLCSKGCVSYVSKVFHESDSARADEKRLHLHQADQSCYT